MNNSDRQNPNNQNKQATDRKYQPSQIIGVKWSCRWDVFRRLKDLGINCQCSTNEPLLIDLYSPTTAIQIWSVVRQCSNSRQDLITWLDNCWQVKCDRQFSE